MKVESKIKILMESNYEELEKQIIKFIKDKSIEHPIFHYSISSYYAHYSVLISWSVIKNDTA